MGDGFVVLSIGSQKAQNTERLAIYFAMYSPTAFESLQMIRPVFDSDEHGESEHARMTYLAVGEITAVYVLMRTSPSRLMLSDGWVRYPPLPYHWDWRQTWSLPLFSALYLHAMRTGFRNPERLIDRLTIFRYVELTEGKRPYPFHTKCRHWGNHGNFRHFW